LLGLAAPSYTALPSTAAVATTTTASMAPALKGEDTTADPAAEVGASPAVPSRSAGGSARPIRSLGVHLLPSGRRGSAHRSLRRLMTCYPVLRKGAPERSPWQAPRDALNVPSYRQWFFGVAGIGARRRLGRTRLTVSQRSGRIRPISRCRAMQGQQELPYIKSLTGAIQDW
jgi:hypothetical protein